MPKTQGRIPLRNRVRELELIYNNAQQRIKEELLSVDIGEYRELRAVSVQDKINGIVKSLNRSAIRWTNQSHPQAYKKSYDISRTRLEILGAERNPEYTESKHTQAMEREIDDTMDYLIKANQSIKPNVAIYLYLIRQAARGLMQIQEFDMRDEETINELLMAALRAGKSRGYAERLIMEHFRKRVGDGQFININGRNYNLRKYSQMVARTRLRHIQSEAIKNSCIEFNNDLVEISAHGTDCASNICQNYEGNIYSISGNHPRYPFLDAWPPFHPRCQHSAAATSEVALKWRGKYA